jgi:FAD-linked sulfhydryl oxidase
MATQTSSRKSAAGWYIKLSLSSQSNTNNRLSRLCFLHNEVNKRLHKPEFDCADLDATYDCGCGDQPVSTKTKVTDPMDLERDISKDDVTGVGLIKGGR